jgi:hypothetical protein
MIDDDFRAVRATAAESTLGGTIQWALARGSAAFAHSSARDLAGRTMSDLRSWTIGDRVRYGAIAVAVAGSVNLALLSVSTSYAAPGIPVLVVGLVIALAIVVALLPESFAAAWRESFVGRQLSRLAGSAQNVAE